jgi:hypothetical protein
MEQYFKHKQRKWQKVDSRTSNGWMQNLKNKHTISTNISDQAGLLFHKTLCFKDKNLLAVKCQRKTEK